MHTRIHTHNTHIHLHKETGRSYVSFTALSRSVNVSRDTCVSVSPLMTNLKQNVRTWGVLDGRREARCPRNKIFSFQWNQSWCSPLLPAALIFIKCLEMLKKSLLHIKEWRSGSTWSSSDGWSVALQVSRSKASLPCPHWCIVGNAVRCDCWKKSGGKLKEVNVQAQFSARVCHSFPLWV